MQLFIKLSPIDVTLEGNEIRSVRDVQSDKKSLGILVIDVFAVISTEVRFVHCGKKVSGTV